MLFLIRRDDIIPNLQATVSVIEKKQTIPILSNVFLKTEGNALLMIGTDLEIQLATKIPVDVHREGQTTISARKFFDVCRNLPNDSVLRIELKENQVVISSGRSRFQIATLDPDNYPSFSFSGYDIEFDIEGNKFFKLLQSTSFCMATQDVRYYLNGLMIEINGQKLGAVASNGHRLALCNECLDKTSNANTQIIIPRKAVMELLRLLDKEDHSYFKMRISTSDIELSLDGTVFLSKLIDGKYPDFKGVLSQNVAKNFVMKTSEFQCALNRVSVLSHVKFRKITLEFTTNRLIVRTDNNEQEQAVEEIDIVYSGEYFEVSLNVTYLLEAINNIFNETVDISFTDRTNICLIRNPANPEIKYVVMPLV